MPSQVLLRSFVGLCSACLLAVGGCATTTTGSAGPVAVPAEVTGYAEALNARDVDQLARLIWFPGPQWPSVPPVPAAEVPRACVQTELDALGGKQLDPAEIQVERRSVEVSPDGGGSYSSSYEIAWFTLPDGSSEGRQVGKVGGRTLVVPAWSDACDAAAVERFGES